MPRGTKKGAARGTFKDPRYLPEAANRLRELRARSGLTQKQVAEAVGIRERAVYEWEHAVRLPMAVLPEIAEVFQTSTAFILHGVEPASEELAALRKEIADLRIFVSSTSTEQGAFLEEVHSALAKLGEDVTSVLELLVAEKPEDDPSSLAAAGGKQDDGRRRRRAPASPRERR